MEESPEHKWVQRAYVNDETEYACKEKSTLKQNNETGK